MGDVYSLDDELDGFIESIELARNERTIRQTLKSFTAALGFSRFAYLHVRGADVLTLSNYQQEWQDIYLDRQYVAIDPVVATARRCMDVFTWSEEMAGSAATATRFFGEAAEFGIRSGISIPVRGSFGRIAMLTLATDQPRADFVKVRDAVRAITAVAFVHVHLSYLRSSQDAVADVTLTPREAHCLAWASRGKTRSETASLLGIKEPTVRFYTESAFDKLGAVNIAHAVRLALEKGLI